MMLRLALGCIRPGMPTRSPPCTSTSDSANATTIARSSLLHSLRCEEKSIDAERSSQSQTVCDGLPFALADIEMIVLRRAPPIDILRRLARDEAAILPEIFAGAGAAAAMQAVNHGGGDAARFEDQARQRRGELLALADPPP